MASLQFWLLIHSEAAAAVSELVLISARRLVMLIRGVCREDLRGRELDITGLVNLCWREAELLVMKVRWVARLLRSVSNHDKDEG